MSFTNPHERIEQLEIGYDELRTVCNRQHDQLMKVEAERDELRRRADIRTGALNEAEVRIRYLEAALPHLLGFSLCPMFDAKGTYTAQKADEWTKRLTDFRAALGAQLQP
jgi:hypothetical protein